MNQQDSQPALSDIPPALGDVILTNHRIPHSRNDFSSGLAAVGNAGYFASSVGLAQRRHGSNTAVILQREQLRETAR